MMLRGLTVADEFITVKVGRLNAHRFVWEIRVAKAAGLDGTARSVVGGGFTSQGLAISDGLAQLDAMCRAKQRSTQK